MLTCTRLQMKQVIIGVLMFVSASVTTAGECTDAVSREPLGIRYEVRMTQGEEERVEQMTLWRLDDRLLQERSGSPFAELWERTRNGGVHLVRYFDDHERAIEYQPEDLGVPGDGPVAERLALFEALCDEGDATLQRGGTLTVWRRLEIVSDPTSAQAAFDRRASYASTDYADIGDNESDPFLLRMINLGFIEHGGSGFYDADGHDMGAGHAH